MAGGAPAVDENGDLYVITGNGPMDADLAALEARVATLIAYARELQEANDILRRELLALQERNRDLNGRVAQATARLDALIAKVPHE